LNNKRQNQETYENEKTFSGSAKWKQIKEGIKVERR
jgi:hypothetical protein